MNMKKITAFLMAMLLVVSFAACGQTEDVTEAPTTVPEETEPTIEALPVNFLTLSLTEVAGETTSIYASLNEDGSAYVELQGDIIKKGNIDSAAWQKLAEAVTVSGLPELNGEKTEGFSEICGEMYFTCGDDMYAASYYDGVIPAAYSDGFKAVKACLEELMKDIPEYVPAPLENGIITESDRAALNGILAGMTLEAPDAFAISNIAVDDEYFAYSTGLSGADGVASALVFAPQSGSIAYSLTIVTLAEGTDADTIAKDFEENVDWLKLVCVQPESGVIAVKDNQVLCLLGSQDMFTQTVSAIDAAGWVPVANLENPNLAG